MKNENKNSFYKINNTFLLRFQSLIFIIFIKITINIDYLYPKAITLLNNNVLVFHENGFNIYDSFLQNSIKSVVSFTSQINEDAYKTKVNIKEMLSSDNTNGIIIAVIANKIYIFNYYDGEILFQEFITEKEYFLSPIKMTESNKYSYLLGYSYDLNKLYLVMKINNIKISKQIVKL